MAQQTALEFILSELDIAKLIEREKLTMAAEVVRQAKAMEKEQIIKAACYEPFLGEFPRKEGEHYYNKIYTK